MIEIYISKQDDDGTFINERITAELADNNDKKVIVSFNKAPPTKVNYATFEQELLSTISYFFSGKY